MKIIEVPKTFTVFSELDPGDVFNYNGVWYMKTESIQIENSYLNAIDLLNGILQYIKPESAVDYQDVELRVEEV